MCQQFAGLETGNANPFPYLIRSTVNTKILNYVIFVGYENCFPLFFCFQQCKNIIPYDKPVKAEEKVSIAVS
jgi:hypothetical protein